MPKYWQTINFKELQKEWEDKLQTSGFVDAEKTIGGERVLVQNSSNAYRQAPEVVRESKIDYYMVLNFRLSKSRFRDEIDKIVMNLHAAGLKIKEICEKLEAIGKGRHRQTVMFIIRKYEHKWKIKKWSKTQLNPQWKHWKKASIK